MTTTAITIIFTAFLSALLLSYLIHHYRKLKKHRHLCDSALSDVETLQAQLITRSEPIIFETQKVLRSETALFQDIKNITQSPENRTLELRITHILLLRYKLKSLYKISQKNPELKDQPQLMTLWEKVEITNRNIDESSSFYNDRVHDYKELTSKFPASMLADIMQYPIYQRI
ncbi:LemA family protein [Ignatzschineria sp. LJL83]